MELKRLETEAAMRRETAVAEARAQAEEAAGDALQAELIRLAQEVTWKSARPPSPKRGARANRPVANRQRNR